ncbi:2,4-dienoyl-CoA reductase-like NADH-dependent reductase (Old Yellow Enzyme family) [Paenibacillus taihuensis]|uniref:2,4-dienoyl-CoA reductase-like NADH-dependent reductase (Old Yellow Enzyme family) n=1 Tax=Paenibacillus taihuensis TaxID=1156355 RepID=A0A3D9SNS7_9BACL|nr:NADH:flavin oxidoreductase/NADH oxidase [Paenibacillus taihuensis]REE91346.1 2,4-dienoyl-CoA reductase-like NADH-dependent reductase (Old Yellow Enzyme family) [Paenibacillus taihuensis]
MNRLATPFAWKGLNLKNRIVMAPMCQYSVDAKDGTPNEWHYVHYVSRAIGGTGLIIMEMTDVEPNGRITDRCLGLWSDEQIPAYRRIIDEVHRHGAKIGIQIAHAGRKAEDAAEPVAPSAIAFNESYRKPRALRVDEIEALVVKFGEAARRAVEAGVDTIELHGAHGYLIHQFHSPVVNKREDEYGQDRAKFGCEVIAAVKSVMPADMPLIMRVSAAEFSDGGYTVEEGIEIFRRYQDAGVDMFHASSGGEAPVGSIKPAIYAGYQVPLARAMKDALGVPVIAVGLLDEPKLADATLAHGHADLVAVARGMLRDPYWALHALQATAAKGADAAEWIPRQYQRGY